MTLHILILYAKHLLYDSKEIMEYASQNQKILILSEQNSFIYMVSNKKERAYKILPKTSN